MRLPLLLASSLLLGCESSPSPRTDVGTARAPARLSVREPAAKAGQPARKLNVLFIAVDDLNVDVSAYGHPVAKTPNIDRLAAWGVRFDRAYCQYPVCNPSRSSFLTGMRPDTTRVFTNGTDPRKAHPNALNLPEHFKTQGYFTACVGKIAHGAFHEAVKWDLDESDEARAINVASRGREGRTKKADSSRRSPEGAKPEERKAKGEGRAKGDPARKGAKKAKAAAGDEEAAGGNLHVPTPVDAADEDLSDGYVARRISELLEEHRNGPFFLGVGLHKPHVPWIAPRKYYDMYPPEAMPLPGTPKDDLADVPKIAWTQNPHFLGMPENAVRPAIAAYRACTSYMDAMLGRILDTLERLKLRESTVIVFFGDHGYHLGEHDLWAKMTLFERSARVPLIVVAPGKPGAVASPRLVELVDLFPTLCELAGVPAVKGIEGTSLAPLLQKPDRPWKKAAFTQAIHGNVTGRSVRTERWRYTEWGSPDVAELYDHETDPQEITNLAKDPRHAATVAELRKRLAEGWQGAKPGE